MSITWRWPCGTLSARPNGTRNVLGLTRVHEEVWESFPAVLGVGTTSVALFPIETRDPLPPPGRDTVAVRHIAFRIGGADYDSAQAELQRRKIAFRFQDHEIAHSIYFQDPDGHQMEITTYELQRSTA